MNLFIRKNTLISYPIQILCGWEETATRNKTLMTV